MLLSDREGAAKAMFLALFVASLGLFYVVVLCFGRGASAWLSKVPRRDMGVVVFGQANLGRGGVGDGKILGIERVLFFNTVADSSF
jgi:hypothetical protein